MILTAVIIILGLGFLIGYRAGIIKIALSMCIGIVSLILVSLLTTPITNFIIENTEIDDKLSARLIETFLEQESDYQDNTVAEVPLVQQINMIESSYLPEFLQESLLSDNNNEMYTQMGVDSFFEYIGAYIARWIIKAAVFIIVFIGVFIAMRILAMVLNVLSMLPIIHGTNKLIGGGLGLLCSLLIIWTMFVGIDMMYEKDWAKEAKVEIEENMLLNTIYSSNFLIKIIGN